jgi:ribosome biogenesis GTPase A
MKLIDVVIELVDARIPYSSMNPDINTLAQNKSRVILLNKADMADQRYNNAWKEYFESKGYYVALINSKSGTGVKQVQDIVNKACQAKIERDRKKGILNRPVRAMIVGIPNVGKSTFINSFVGKATAKTGNKPGVTKGKQWIRLNKFVELMDTPGILWPKFEDQSVGLRLALIGSINDTIINTTDLTLELLLILEKHYPEVITNRYGVETFPDALDIKAAYEMLKQIALKRSCLLKGGEPDVDRIALLILDDFRSTKLGNITLEFPDELKEIAGKQEKKTDKKTENITENSDSEYNKEKSTEKDIENNTEKNSEKDTD